MLQHAHYAIVSSWKVLHAETRKVWLLLEEKQVDYEVEKVPMRSYGRFGLKSIVHRAACTGSSWHGPAPVNRGDKPREFMALVPRGLLPAMEIDGKVMTESLDIMLLVAVSPTCPCGKCLESISASSYFCDFCLSRFALILFTRFPSLPFLLSLQHRFTIDPWL